MFWIQDCSGLLVVSYVAIFAQIVLFCSLYVKVLCYYVEINIGEVLVVLR